MKTSGSGLVPGFARRRRICSDEGDGRSDQLSGPPAAGYRRAAFLDIGRTWPDTGAPPTIEGDASLSKPAFSAHPRPSAGRRGPPRSGSNSLRTWLPILFVAAGPSMTLPTMCEGFAVIGAPADIRVTLPIRPIIVSTGLALRCVGASGCEAGKKKEVV